MTISSNFLLFITLMSCYRQANIRKEREKRHLQYSYFIIPYQSTSYLQSTQCQYALLISCGMPSLWTTMLVSLPLSVLLRCNCKLLRSSPSSKKRSLSVSLQCSLLSGLCVSVFSVPLWISLTLLVHPQGAAASLRLLFSLKPALSPLTSVCDISRA